MTSVVTVYSEQTFLVWCEYDATVDTGVIKEIMEVHCCLFPRFIAGHHPRRIVCQLSFVIDAYCDTYVSGCRRVADIRSKGV